MNTYEQLTGRWLRDGALLSTGYSGHGAGLNNPAMQNVEGVGPIPRGRYTIGPARDDAHLGPLVMRLIPDPGNQMFDRSAFDLHGDNPQMNHTASDGCIIMGHDLRAIIAIGTDRALTVV